MPKTARRIDAIVAYVPVIHRGYLELFEKYPWAPILVLDENVLADFPHLRSDLRAVNPKIICKMLRSVFFRRDIGLAHPPRLHLFSSSSAQLCFPDEDIMHEIMEIYHLPESQIAYDKTFLRWNKLNVTSENEVPVGRKISRDDFHRQVMGQACQIGQKSPDWWRQVGATLVKDGEVFFSAFNHHCPTDYVSYVDGDIRGCFDFGERLEICGAIHAEGAIISKAASLMMAGADLFCTTFPCPACARLIAASGIHRLFYVDGYSVSDAFEIFQAAGIEVIKVEMTD